MKIEIFKYQPFVFLDVLENSENWYRLECLIDTGFTGTIAFGIHNWDIFKIIEISDITEEKKENWITLANGRKTKTFSANIFLNINNMVQIVPIYIFEAEDEEPPLIGMKFLEMFNGKLLLDFQKDNFSLHL